MRNFILFTCIILMGLSCSRRLNRMYVNYPEKIANVKIHEADSFVGPCEPSICIDPSNPARIVAGSILDNVYVSEDYGMTWSKNKLKSTFGVYGDPVIRIGPNSEIYYAHLSNPTGRAYVDDEFLDRIVVQKSTDGGKIWNNGTHPAVRGSKDQDKQWTYIDPNDGTILMSWTEFDKYNSKKEEDRSRILFSKSTDSGETWTEPLIISEKEGDCLDDDFTTEGALPVVDQNGNYHIVWAFDGKLYHDHSTDKGATWQEKDQEIADQVGGWSMKVPGIGRCNGMPVLDIDLNGGRFHGRMYVNYADQRNGEDNTDIWTIFSEDDGKTWSEPVRVNNDVSSRHQFFSWMDVDPISGVVYIVFYDRRETEGDDTDVYLAYSADGGINYENKKISESSFSPNKNVFFGDYNDISAYDNKVRPIWTRLDKAKLSVWTAIVDME